MDTIEETLRKSKQVQERYRQFLQKKKQSDQSMKQTMKKIDETQKKLQQTKQTIKTIDNMYQKYQQSLNTMFQNAVDQLSQSEHFLFRQENFQPWHSSQKQIVQLLKDKNNVVFITGAGISVASGIATFRGKDGYWTKENQDNKDLPPTEILTQKYYSQYPFQTWNWLENFYQQKIKNKPNKGHLALAQIANYLRQNKKNVTMITQNIDNYHIEAYQQIKNKKKIKDKQNQYPIYPIHGNILTIRCDTCMKNTNKFSGYLYSKWRQQINKQIHPRCPKCESALRPHIMFFDEVYQEIINHSDTAFDRIKQADLLIVIGTTLQTGLVRKLVSQCLKSQNKNKIEVVQINPQCVIHLSRVRRIQGKSQQVLTNIKNYLIK